MKALASRLGLNDEGGAPGEALDEGLRIACGDGGAVRLLRVQREGRGAQDAEELLRGFPVPAGTRLG
jgi:methionyl-tRNA formyltransferase